MTLDADLKLSQGAFRLDARFASPDGVTALFGPSGSGKSTLLAAIAGLKRAKGGVTLQGQNLRHTPAHRRNIGLVFQDARLFPHLTVRGNMMYSWRRADPARRRSIEDVARFFDIAAFLDRRVTNLSGGEHARVALARAVVAAPRLLLLDEPFAALDGVRRRAFMRVLRDMHAQFALPMLVVTHAIDDAAAFADHLVALRDGEVVAQGAFRDASSTPAFQALLDARDTGAALSGQALVKGDSKPAYGVWLRADHVLLASHKPEAVSARNVWEGEVTAVIDEDASRLVTLQTHAGAIRSRLTPQAVQELGLKPGSPAWALVKAHSV